jgi:hypothetical protein
MTQEDRAIDWPNEERVQFLSLRQIARLSAMDALVAEQREPLDPGPIDCDNHASSRPPEKSND